tara:strand:- start:4453 stop:4971 length:519 start_codon:yes stop_codon:yes gene_type:complete
MAKKDKTVYKCYTEKGERFMICRNSTEDASFWGWTLLKDTPRCFNWNKVGSEVTAVLCPSCSNKVTDPPKFTPRYKPTGRPKGWQWMSEFVDTDGTVYFKGDEQPKLKGTLPITKIASTKSKKRITKREREALKRTLMAELYDLKKRLKKVTLKKDKNSIETKIRKITRKIK